MIVRVTIGGVQQSYPIPQEALLETVDRLRCGGKLAGELVCGDGHGCGCADRLTQLGQ